MTKRSRLLPGSAKAASNLFWNAVRQRLRLTSDADLASLIGLDPAPLSRARKSIDPFYRVHPEKQLRLLEELAKTFEKPDQMRIWLATIKWSLTDEQADWLDTHFRQRRNQWFLRLLSAYYEPRPVLEAEILEHLRPSRTPYAQRLIAHSGVLLSGIRGQGKTALALGALSSDPLLDEEFPDGIYFLDCHQQSTEQCLEAFAAELGRDIAGLATEQRSAVVRQLAHEKSLLLILDDVEDIQTIRKFYNLLGSCITSRLLITSYQRLTPAALGELRLYWLEVPDLTSAEGRRLAERALRQSLPPAEQAAFDQLLNRIAGHPLALTILIGLKDDTQSTWGLLLSAIDQSPLGALAYPDATDKEGSVRLCFELVYQRLADRHPRAAAVFRATGVFASARGTIGLLCEVAELTEEVETTLQYLVRYQLLSIEVGAVGDERSWQVHTLLHDFAAQKLREEPAGAEQTQRRYLQAVVSTANRLRVEVERKPSTYQQLKAIREDLLQAIRIARQLDNPNAALEIIDRCADLLVKGGKAEQLAPILDEVSAIWADVPAMIQARMLGIRGQIEFARLRPKQAIEYFEKALQFDLSLQGRIELLLALAPCYRLIDQREKAALVVEEIGMWVLLNSPSPPTLWAAVRAAQAEVALDRGNYVHARQQFVRAEEEYEETGWGLSAAQMQISQAWCLLHENQPAEALRLLDQARTFFNTQNWPLIYLDGLAEIYCQAFLMQRNFDALQAELEQWEQLLSSFTEIDVTVQHAKLWQWRGRLAENRGQYAEAVSAYQQALEFWQPIPFSEIAQRHVKDQIEIVRKMAETS